MVQRVSTVAFEGIEARAVDVQVQVALGLPAFAIVGLPDKAVSEARERVRSELIVGWRGRRGESRSTSRPPICPRKAAITICRSHSG
jgi:Subunit ChlI of Mg-chelatase